MTLSRRAQIRLAACILWVLALLIMPEGAYYRQFPAWCLTVLGAFLWSVTYEQTD